MDNQFEEDEHARSSRRAQKIEEMKREKERQMQQSERFRKYLPIIGGAVCAVVVIGIGGSAIVRHGKNRPEQNQEAAQVQIQEDVSQTDGSQTEEGSVEYTDVAEEPSYEPFVTQATESTTAVDGEVVSANVIIIEEKTGNILAQRDAYARISPASMTKVLTVLVAAEHVENLDDKEIVALSNAQAWETETDEYISIANIEYELEAKEGQYPVTFSTSNGTSIERTIFVVNQPFVKNEKANEGVMAFNFFKTVDEITESQALDTDLKTWANAQGWKLTDEDQSVDISVDYDFDPEEVTEGVYEITFSTTGREFKIHTTDYSAEGQEVGLTFFPEDIHVMPKVVF